MKKWLQGALGCLNRYSKGLLILGATSVALLVLNFVHVLFNVDETFLKNADVFIVDSFFALYCIFFGFLNKKHNDIILVFSFFILGIIQCFTPDSSSLSGTIVCCICISYLIDKKKMYILSLVLVFICFCSSFSAMLFYKESLGSCFGCILFMAAFLVVHHILFGSPKEHKEIKHAVLFNDRQKALIPMVIANEKIDTMASYLGVSKSSINNILAQMRKKTETNTTVELRDYLRGVQD